MERNQSQENYNSTQDHFICQPTAPSVKKSEILINHIYQPPPLGQDVTQVQFLSGV